MRTSTPIIFASDHAWRVGTAHDEQASMFEVPADQIQSLQQLLATKGLSPGEVILAIPSAWCLTASLSAQAVARLNRQALTMALEEHLPIVAEHVVADFVRTNDRILGVCVERAKLSELIKSTEGDGWSVMAVCPAAMLALPQWILACPEARNVDAILGAEEGQWVLLSVENGGAVGLSFFPDEVDDLRVRLDVLAAKIKRQPRLLVCGLPSEQRDSLDRLDGVAISYAAKPTLEEAATFTAAKILSGKNKPPIDLTPADLRYARHVRAQRPLVMAASCFVVFLMALIASLLIAGHRIDLQTQLLVEQQDNLFRQVSSDSHRPPPRDVSRYLASELQRLSDPNDQNAKTPGGGLAMQMLADLFNRLPGQLPLQVDGLHVEADHAELVGQVSSHEDAGKLAEALSADGALIVPPPQTSLGQNNHVDFILQVQRKGISQNSAEAAP